MSGQLKLSNGHFKSMKATINKMQKDWEMAAIGSVKEHVKDLNRLTREVEDVIKNQLYHGLKPEGPIQQAKP